MKMTSTQSMTALAFMLVVLAGCQTPAEEKASREKEAATMPVVAATVQPAPKALKAHRHKVQAAKVAESKPSVGLSQDADKSQFGEDGANRINEGERGGSIVSKGGSSGSGGGGGVSAGFSY